MTCVTSPHVGTEEDCSGPQRLHTSNRGLAGGFPMALLTHVFGLGSTQND